MASERPAAEGVWEGEGERLRVIDPDPRSGYGDDLVLCIDGQGERVLVPLSRFGTRLKEARDGE